jgi:hypothetical protein
MSTLPKNNIKKKRTKERKKTMTIYLKQNYSMKKMSLHDGRFLVELK